MKPLYMGLLMTSLTAPVAHAGGHASGDAAEGEKAFRQCRSCHMIETAEGEAIVKGGKTGPNLWGLPGRTAGSVEDFRYSSLLETAGEQELVWTEEEFTAFVQDPTGYLTEKTGESGRSKMAYKARSEEDVVNIWAYIASVSPEPES